MTKLPSPQVLKQMSHGASSVSGDADADAAENEEFLRNVIDQTMAEVDKDNSGEISFEEFKNVRNSCVRLF